VKVQAYLSWFGRTALLPKALQAGRPADISGNGVIAWVLDELLEGAFNFVNADSRHRSTLLARGAAAVSELSFTAASIERDP